jgi:GTPase SAR1 family protein
MANATTPGLLFVVDSNDRDRIAEVPSEISLLLHEGELSRVPFFFLFNKQDLANAMVSHHPSWRVAGGG